MVAPLRPWKRGLRMRSIISENQKSVKAIIRKIRKLASAHKPGPGAGENHAARSFRAALHFSGVRPACVFAALRARAAALARKRSIWPLGRVTQISPIHSSFTPLIGLALKLVRLTRVEDFPRSMVFR